MLDILSMAQSFMTEMCAKYLLLSSKSLLHMLFLFRSTVIFCKLPEYVYLTIYGSVILNVKFTVISCTGSLLLQSSYLLCRISRETDTV